MARRKNPSELEGKTLVSRQTIVQMVAERLMYFSGGKRHGGYVPEQI